MSRKAKATRKTRRTRQDMTLADLQKQIPKGGLLDPSLRKGYGKLNLESISKSVGK